MAKGTQAYDRSQVFQPVLLPLLWVVAARVGEQNAKSKEDFKEGTEGSILSIRKHHKSHSTVTIHY